MIVAPEYKALSWLVDQQIAHWPEHKKFLSNSFSGRDGELLKTCEMIAALVVKIASHVDGGLPQLCADYHFLCEDIVLPEEEFFRRNNRYRITKFEEALREVYNNSAFMSRYMNGLLLSDIFWDNHARAMHGYKTKFLDGLKPKASHLEIGPGHGLLLYIAANHPNVATIAAWDVSPTSIAQTRRALDTFGITRPVKLELQSLFAAGAPASDADRFDSIVISEVLEHLEDPLAALRVLHERMKPGGRLWVHVPANSPAPDHIYLIRDPNESLDLVRQAGFKVVNHEFFPMSGATLEKSRKFQLAVSCTVVGERS